MIYIYFFIIIVLLILYISNIYNTIDKFVVYKKCKGKRDGISGCRNCCSIKVPKNYNKCVSYCMNY